MSLALSCLCLLAAGCLYIESINHPPEAVIDPVGGEPSRMQKCKQVIFDGSSSFDPDEDTAENLSFEWQLQIMDQGALRDVTAAEAQVVSPTTSRLQVLPLVAGSFSVQLETIDRHGARSQPAERAFTVADAPPVAMLGLDGTVPSGCMDFVAASKVGISARRDTDPDQTCTADPGDYHVEAITFHWTLTTPAGSVAAAVGDGTCSEADLQPGTLAITQGAQSGSPGEVCVVTDLPGTYTLTALVDDGGLRTPAEQAADGQIASFTLVAAGDRPPCLEVAGASPLPASYVLSRSTTQTFAVGEVLDDLDGYPSPGTGHFAWSLWRASDPTWRPVEGWDQAALPLDPTEFGVDEEVQIRVAAGDRVLRDLSACDPAAAICSYATAYPNDPDCWPSADCAAWVTWEARFR